MSLPDLSGGPDIIEHTKDVLSRANSNVVEYINYVEELSRQVMQHNSDVQLHFDFAALSGYHYQNGAVFAAYVSGQGEQIARGGRYDMIGEAFGRSRPATGFSLDLKALEKISSNKKQITQGIFAPNDDDPRLQEKITQLRSQGERVICELKNQHGDASEIQCNRILVKDEQEKNQQWIVKELE